MIEASSQRRRLSLVRRGALLAVGLAATLALGACSSSPQQSMPETDASVAEQPTSTLSPRGAQPAAAGERLEIWGPPMAPSPGQYITIKAIRPVTSCKGKDIDDQGHSIPAKPENGRFLALDLRVENTAAYDPAQPGYYPGTNQQFDFVAQSGTALNDVDTTVAFYCSGERQSFETNQQSGRVYEGVTYIDVPNDAGWLMYGQSSFSGFPGFEFEIPAAAA